MWGESTATVANRLFENSGQVLAFVGVPPASASGDAALAAEAAKALRTFKSVQALMEQGVFFHILCQGNIASLCSSIGLGKDSFSVLNVKHAQGDGDEAEMEDQLDAIDMGRALMSHAKMVVAINIDFGAYPAVDLCTFCSTSGGYVHILGNSARSGAEDTIDAGVLLAPEVSTGAVANIIHRFDAGVFLSSVLKEHFGVEVPLENFPPFDPSRSTTKHEFQQFHSAWMNLQRKNLDIPNAAEEGEQASPPKKPIQARADKTKPQRAAGNVPSKRKDKKSKRKKSGKRKEGKGSTAALKRLHRRLQTGIVALSGSSPLRAREDLLDVLTDLHIFPPPSRRKLDKCPGLGASMAELVAQLNDAVDADAIQIVESTTLLVNKWKLFLARETGDASAAEQSALLLQELLPREMLSDTTPVALQLPKSESNPDRQSHSPPRKQFLSDVKPDDAPAKETIAAAVAAAAEHAVSAAKTSAQQSSATDGKDKAVDAARKAETALLFTPSPKILRATVGDALEGQVIEAEMVEDIEVETKVVEDDKAVVSKPRCRMFMLGSCSAGKDCPFSHEVG